MHKHIHTHKETITTPNGDAVAIDIEIVANGERVDVVCDCRPMTGKRAKRANKAAKPTNESAAVIYNEHDGAILGYVSRTGEKFVAVRIFYNGHHCNDGGLIQRGEFVNRQQADLWINAASYGA